MVDLIPRYFLHLEKNADMAQFKPLSAEDRAFLEKAMEEFTFSDSKKITVLLKEIQEKKPPALETLEELQDVLDSLDAFTMMVQMGGLPILLELIFDNEDKETK